MPVTGLVKHTGDLRRAVWARLSSRWTSQGQMCVPFFLPWPTRDCRTAWHLICRLLCTRKRACSLLISEALAVTALRESVPVYFVKMNYPCTMHAAIQPTTTVGLFSRLVTTGTIDTWASGAIQYAVRIMSRSSDSSRQYARHPPCSFIYAFLDTSEVSILLNSVLAEVVHIQTYAPPDPDNAQPSVEVWYFYTHNVPCRIDQEATAHHVQQRVPSTFRGLIPQNSL